MTCYRPELTLARFETRVSNGETFIDITGLGRGQWLGLTVECKPDYQAALSELYPNWTKVDLYEVACTLDQSLMPVNVLQYIKSLPAKFAKAGGREKYMQSRTLELMPEESVVINDVNAAVSVSQALMSNLISRNPVANGKRSSMRAKTLSPAPKSSVPPKSSYTSPKKKRQKRSPDSDSVGMDSEHKADKRKISSLETEVATLNKELSKSIKDLNKANKDLSKSTAQFELVQSDLAACRQDLAEEQNGNGSVGHRLTKISKVMYRIVGNALHGESEERRNAAYDSIDVAFESES